MSRILQEENNLVPNSISDIELIRKTIKGRGMSFKFVSDQLGIPYSYFKKIIGGFYLLTDEKRMELFRYLKIERNLSNGTELNSSKKEIKEND